MHKILFYNKFIICLISHMFFDILLTVHLSIILVINYLNAQNLIL